jgi:hypothetical protein
MSMPTLKLFRGHNHSFYTDGEGHYEFSLGNWSDAGWHWDGKADSAVGFLIRIARSKITDDFLKDAKEANLTFKEMKPALMKALKKNDGLYELSGDNEMWQFGYGAADMIDTTTAEEEAVEAGATKEQASEEVDTKFNNMKIDYEDFEKAYGSEYQQYMTKLIKGAKTFEDFFGKLEEEGIRQHWFEEVDGFVGQAYAEAKGTERKKTQKEYS